MHDYLSTPRKSAFETFFSTSTKAELQGVYRWHQAVSSTFMALMNDFEIVLRNTIHFALSNYYDPSNSDSFDWMGSTIIQTGASPNHIAHRLNGSRRFRNNGDVDYTGALGKIQDAIREIVDDSEPVTPDAVVAKLSFGFWPILLDKLKHPSHSAYKATLLHKMFLNAPSHDDSFRNLISAQLFQIRLLRNRLGHHDSLLKFREVNHLGVPGFFPVKPRHTINSMKLMVDNMVRILDWVDHNLAISLRQSDHWSRLANLLSVDMMGYYRFHHGNANSYEKGIIYKEQIKKAKLFQAKKKYRKAKFPEGFNIIKSYPH